MLRFSPGTTRLSRRKLLRPHEHAGAVPVVTTAVELHHPKGVVGVISRGTIADAGRR